MRGRGQVDLGAHGQFGHEVGVQDARDQLVHEVHALIGRDQKKEIALEIRAVGAPDQVNLGVRDHFDHEAGVLDDDNQAVTKFTL